MKGAFRGSQKITLRVRAIGKIISTLTGLLVFLSSTAFGQVILDDFSTNKRLDYEFVEVFGTAADGWAVTGGQLQPSIGSSGSATWLWQKGEQLAAIGDSVSISLSLPTGLANGTSIGLFLSVDAASIVTGHEISQTFSHSDNVDVWSYRLDSSGPSIQTPPTGPVQVTVQRSGQTVEGFGIYTTSFSGGGLASPITDSFESDTSAPLQFGPFAFNTTGAPAALDNFTFTAVPEPSMYAAVFGLLALMTGVVRSRISRRS